MFDDFCRPKSIRYSSTPKMTAPVNEINIILADARVLAKLLKYTLFNSSTSFTVFSFTLTSKLRTQ